MKQIKIGTCVPGTKAEEWLKGFVGKGFETFSINFHMSLEGTDLDKLALTTDKLLAGTDSKGTSEPSAPLGIRAVVPSSAAQLCGRGSAVHRCFSRGYSCAGQ